MNPLKQILWSILALFVLLLCFENTNLDLLVQDYFYNDSAQQWILDTSHPVPHFLLYDGAKAAVICWEILLLIALIFFRKKPIVNAYRQGITVVLIAIPLSAGLVSALKNLTNIACPYALSHYGGDIPYVRIFDHYPVGLRPQKQQRCFPAGHASAGFALLALYYLPKTQKRKKQFLALALSAGTAMGTYKMLLGHHFISHTLITMVLCWLMVNIVALCTQRFSSTEPSEYMAINSKTG
jgi:membrane-associated PAP2 superfamily phosphatase